MSDPLAYRKYCKDLAGDAYYHWLVRYRLVPQGAAVLLVAAAVGWAAVPLVFFLPVVCWMHSTYAVNSVCHDARFGSRLFETREGSRNVWWVGLLALGEGWHNNHHAHPRSARHGLGPRQPDLSYLVIRLLGAAGLAWNLKRAPAAAPRRRAAHARPAADLHARTPRPDGAALRDESALGAA